MKSLKSMSDKWFEAVCWNYFLLGILMIKLCVAFGFIVLGTLKYDWDIKTRSDISVTSETIQWL